MEHLTIWQQVSLYTVHQVVARHNMMQLLVLVLMSWHRLDINRRTALVAQVMDRLHRRLMVIESRYNLRFMEAIYSLPFMEARARHHQILFNHQITIKEDRYKLSHQIIVQQIGNLHMARQYKLTRDLLT